MGIVRYRTALLTWYSINVADDSKHFVSCALLRSGFFIPFRLFHFWNFQSAGFTGLGILAENKEEIEPIRNAATQANWKILKDIGKDEVYNKLSLVVNGPDNVPVTIMSPLNWTVMVFAVKDVC